MFRPLLLAAFAMTPVAAFAQQAETGKPPERIRSVTLTDAKQLCPKSTEEEVVVCSRINPGEQYRLPKELRQSAEIPARNQSWVNRAATMDQISRVAGGLPDTCSPVGSGGHTGCALAINRAYAAEKKAAERNDALVPGAQ